MALVHERRQDPYDDRKTNPETDSGEKAAPSDKKDAARGLGNTSPEKDSADAPSDSGSTSQEVDSADTANDLPGEDDKSADVSDDRPYNGKPSRSSSNDESDKEEEEKNTPVKKDGEEEDKFDDKNKKEKEKFDKKNEKEQEKDLEKNTHEGRKDDDKKGKPDEDASIASLRLELWLPVPMRDLKGSEKGELSLFLDTLKTELATAANISVERLDMLGVRGEYEDEGVLSFFARDVKASLQDGPVIAEEMGASQSIVDIEVLPSTQTSDPSPQKVLTMIREQLGESDSPLMKGPLKKTLSGAKLVIGRGVSGLLPGDHSGATHQESRLAPLVVAAMLFPFLSP